MENIDKSEISKNASRIVKGSIASIFISLILLFIFALVLTYTQVPENTINPVIIVISSISIFIGSGISTLKMKKNGLLNGGLVGVIYVFTIYLLSAITGTGFGINLYTAIMMIASIFFGMLGGIIGINMK